MTVKTVKGVAAGIDHGTARGYRQHMYREVPSCEDCRRAYRESEATKKPRGNRQTQSWNGGMVGESRASVAVSATPARCTEPKCGGAAASVPNSWVTAVVGGVMRRYCRSWCAVYAEALFDVRSIGQTEVA